MQAIRKRYFPALAKYNKTCDATSLYHYAELDRLLSDVNPPNSAQFFREGMNKQPSTHTASGKELRLFYPSFLALFQQLVANRGNDPAGLHMAQRISELSEQLVSSERSFQHTKNRYENILQHMDTGIAIFDSEGTLSFLNLQMAKLLEIPRKLLIGCTVRAILSHRQLRRSTKKTIVGIMKEMAKQRFRDYEFQDSAGRHLLMNVTYGDQLDGDYLISVKDVSEYKKIEQTAYQNDKLAMLGKISAAIAHEIRNPLTAIRGFIQLLQPHLAELGKDEYARIILSEIDRANNIIYEFLNSSKPTPPMTLKIPIACLLKEVTMLMESEALMRGCQIHFLSYDENLIVSIDVKQIKQVILNIVKNSLDAIAELHNERNGRIDIEVRKEGDSAAVIIKDNGKGMDQTIMTRLFDPFFTTKESGTGLGLSVSYRIIRNHGGSIRVESSEGEGTAFYVHLPLVT
jgi:PAS domain S-box-containing protein